MFINHPEVFCVSTTCNHSFMLTSVFDIMVKTEILHKNKFIKQLFKRRPRAVASQQHEAIRVSYNSFQDRK